MEEMLVVVFDDETKAYEGSKALGELDDEGNISIYAEAVVQKAADGKITVKKESDDVPIRTVSGTAIGALIGLLGGPIGVGIGAVTGTFAGGILDINRSGVNADFLDEVSAKLTSGKWAIIADVSEEWETPVDTSMAAVGGTVSRSVRKDIQTQQRAAEVAGLKAEIAKLKDEQAKASTEQKAKIQRKIDDSNKKLHVKLDQAKKASEQQQKEAKAKTDALTKKVAKAKGDAKAKIEARIAEIKKQSQESKEANDKLQEEGKD